MPRLLSPEEYEERFGGGYRAEAPRAGLGTLLGSGVDRMQAGLYGLVEEAGLPTADLRRQNEVEAAGSAARFYQDNPEQPRGLRDVDGPVAAGRFARNLLVQSAPELATSLGAGAFGVVRGVGTLGRLGMAAAAGYPMAVADIMQNQREEAGYANPASASVLGVPYVAADMVGLEGALASGRFLRTGLRNLDELQGARGVAARTAANAGLNFVAEGGSETLQEGVNQLGRMTVNRDQTFFNPEANERYLESFVGGGLMGSGVSTALGGWRRTPGYQGPTVDEGQFDLTQRSTPAAPQYNLITDPGSLQGRIDRRLGIDRTTDSGYAKQLEEMFAAPSGQYVIDPQTGLERQLTVGELYDMRTKSIAPTSPSLFLPYDRRVQSPTTYNPLGSVVVFPDGSVALGSEAELQRRYEPDVQPQLTTQLNPLQPRIDQNLGIGASGAPRDYAKQFTAAYDEPSGQFAIDRQTGAERELTMGEYMALLAQPAQERRFTLVTQPAPLQQRIDQNLGISRASSNRRADAAAAVTAPSGVPVQNPQTGVERQLDMGEWMDMQAGGAQPGVVSKQQSSAAFSPDERWLMDRGVKPTKKSIELGREMQAAGLDDDALLPVLTALQQSKLGQARKLLAAAIADKNKPGATNVSTEGAAAAGPGAGGAGRSVAPAGGVGNTGSVPDVQRGGSRDAGNPQPAGNQADALADARVQRPAGVARVSRVASDPFQVESALDEQTQDELEIARLTGRRGEADAIEDEAEGRRADATFLGSSQYDAVLDERFKSSENPERDRRVLAAYLTALRDAPSGSKVAIQTKIGEDFGIKPVTVRKIGNPQAMIQAGRALGFSADQVLDAMGVDSTTKGELTERGQLLARAKQMRARLPGLTGPSRQRALNFLARVDERIQRLDERGADRDGAVAAGLSAAGVQSVEGAESGFSRLDDNREWQKESSGGNKAADRLLELQDRIEGMRRTAAQLEADGVTEAARKLQELLAAEQAKLDTLLAQLQTKREAPRKAKAEPEKTDKQLAAEARAAERQKLQDEGAGLAAEAAAKRSAERKGLEVGDTVQNPKLGTGQVMGFSGNGAETKVTVKFNSGQTKELMLSVAKLEKVAGETAPQTSRALTTTKATPAVAKDSGQRLWDRLRQMNAELVPYEDLTNLERGYLTELADRTDGEPVIKNELGLQELMGRTQPQQLGDDSNVIDVEARVVEETVAPQVLALPEPQIERLERHYGAKRDSAEFLSQVRDDVVRYVNEGAQAVAGAIRSIIKAISEGVLAVALVFNPNINASNFSFDLPQVRAETVTETVEIRDQVPANAVAKMSELAQQVYENMAPTAKASGKGFIIADKPNGMVHFFNADGSVLVQDSALFGKDTGDTLAGNSLAGGKKITPAGKFTLTATRDAEYAGGMRLDLAETYDPSGVVAIHAAYLGNPAENRRGRLASPSAADNKISYGCINTSHDTFLKSVLPNIENFNGGMLFVLPDAQEATAAMFPAETRTTTRTETTRTQSAANSDVGSGALGREGEGRSAQRKTVGRRGVRRLARGDSFDLTVDGKDYLVDVSDEQALRQFPGVDAALDYYDNNGLRNVVDGVELWLVAPDSVDFDAAIVMADGKRALAIRAGLLADDAQSEWAIHHELGHIADDAFRDTGVFSGLPEFNLRLSGSRVVGMGAVAKEVMAYVQANPDSPVTETLGYPLDRTRNSKLSADETRMELFAQLWAIYTIPGSRKFLASAMPQTYKLLENINEALRSEGSTTQDGAAATQARQGQATRQADRGAEGGSEAVQGEILRLTRGAAGFGTSTSGTGETIRKTLDSVPPKVRAPIRDILVAAKDVSAKGLDLVVFTNDLIARAVQAGVQSAKTFQDLLVQRAERMRTEEMKVERIADMYALVPEVDRGNGPRSVNQFLFESTRQGKWGYDNGSFKADAEMAEWFDSLKPESQAFVRAVFKHGDDVLARKKRTVLDHTETEFDARIAAETDPAKKAELEQDKKASLKRFQTLFALREGKPYAPIKRTGNYVVIAKSQAYMQAEQSGDTKRMAELEKNEADYQVSFTDTKWEARRMAERLDAAGGYGQVYLRERDKHQDSMYGGDGVLKSLAKLRSRVEGSEDKSSAKVLRMVSDLYLEALAEESARKSEMRRRGIAGEVDMLASFAKQGRADANFMASVEFGQRIQDSLRAMSKEVQSARDDGRASEIRNELVARYEQALDRPETPWINRLSRLSSVYYLATSPGYYMQNLTQPWMMSLPAMTGRHDYTAASRALFSAYGELKDVVKSGKLLKQNFDLSKVPADVRSAIDELAKRGKIDIGMESEMGEFAVEGKGRVGRAINKIDKGLRLAVQKVETINRLSTAMAAYRLELARTGSAEAALDYADRILTETHGDYTGFNAPRAFNTNLGKLALQFRKFQLIQLTYYAKLVNDIFTNPKERRAALKMLGFSLGHTALLAGVRGLPGFAALAWMASALLGDDDEPFDLEQQLRQGIGDPDLANLIMRGAPTLGGLDLSGKVGAGNMLSVLPFSNADLTTQAGRNQAVGELLLGATGGMVSKVADGMGLLLGGDYYRGIEQMMPKGVSDVLKAAREGSEGMTRRNGDLMLSAEEISFAESLMTGLGFSPVQKSVVYEQQQRVRSMDQNFQERSTRVKNDYAKAVRERDAEAMAEARDAWTKLQEARVRNGYTRQPMSNLLKAPQEQAKRERNTVNGVPFNRQNRGFVESQI